MISFLLYIDTNLPDYRLYRSHLELGFPVAVALPCRVVRGCGRHEVGVVR